MKAAVTGLPMVMAELSEVVSMAVSNHSSSDSSDLNTRVSCSSGSTSSSSSGMGPVHPDGPVVDSGCLTNLFGGSWCLAHETPV